MSSRLGSPAGRFSSLTSFVAWLRAAPDGTVLAGSALLEILEDLHGEAPRPEDDASKSESAHMSSWREKIWTVPAETRLGIIEAAEALGRPRSFVYRRTSAKSGLSKIPHRKLDGSLIFQAGELRTWLASAEESVVKSAPKRAEIRRRMGRTATCP